MFLKGESDFQFFVNGQQLWNGPQGCGDGRIVYQSSTEFVRVPVRISWKIPSTTNTNGVSVWTGNQILYANEDAPPVGSATLPYIPNVVAEVKLEGRDTNRATLLDSSGARQQMFCRFNGSLLPLPPDGFTLPGDGAVPGNNSTTTGDGTVTVPSVCVGTIICSIPDMWVYLAAGLVLLLAAK